VEEGAAILKKYGIDPVFGKEVLIWAPNTGHDIDNLGEVLRLLRAADKTKSKAVIIDALNEAGKSFIRKAVGA
jgi:hypothetical protein